MGLCGHWPVGGVRAEGVDASGGQDDRVVLDGGPVVQAPRNSAPAAGAEIEGEESLGHRRVRPEPRGPRPE